MPTSLDSLRNRLTSALADRKISVSEADALVKQAQADGLAPEEAAFLEDTVARYQDAFDFGAADVMSKAISLDGAPTRRELADPAVLNKHTGSVSYSWVPGNLFVDGVKETDVIQGQIANCYMVSSFAAIAHTHPDAIQNAIKDNGDGTFTVRFFQQNGYGAPTPVNVTVDGELPTRYGSSLYYAKGADRSELWVPLLEKAFAQWKGGYEAIGNGGSPADVMGALLGTRDQYVGLYEGMNGDRLFQQLKAGVDSGKSVVAATHGEDQEALYTGTGMYAWHAYTVLGVSEENGQKYVTLRNPWGQSEPSGNGPDDGIFKLNMADFSKFYAGVWMN